MRPCSLLKPCPECSSLSCVTPPISTGHAYAQTIATGLSEGMTVKRAHMRSCSFSVPLSRWSLTRPGVPTTTSQPRLRMLSWGP